MTGFSAVGEAASDGRGGLLLGLQLLGRKLAGRLDFLRQLLGAELADGQELEDAVLHVLQPVVVLVEDLGGVVEVEAVVRPRVPGELGHPFEVGPDDLAFHRLPAGPLQSPEFALDLGPGLLRELDLVETLPQLDQVAGLVVFPQLLLDRLELLAEVHLALPLAELLLDLRLDLGLRLEHADLALDVDQDAAHPLLDAEGLQEALLLGGRQVEVAGDDVGEPARIVDRVEDLVEDFLGQAATFAQLHRPLADLAVHGGEGRVLRVDRLDLGDGGEVGDQEAVFVREAEGIGPPVPLEQELDAAEAPLDLADPGDHAHRIKLVRGRLVLVLALGAGEEEAARLHGCLDRFERARPAHADRDGQTREDHRSTHGERRQVETREHWVRLFHPSKILIGKALMRILGIGPGR